MKSLLSIAANASAHPLAPTVKTAALAAAIFFCVFFISCSDDAVEPNQPPTVWLSGTPPEGSITSYKIEMLWGGYDPDGQVAYYEYVVTDNDDGTFDPADTTGRDKWNKIYGDRKQFNFTADVLVDSLTGNMIAEFERSHTFFIRAVDNEGLASLAPAYRSFTARTLSPAVNVLMPRSVGTIGLEPAKVPVISTFRWVAQDFIDDLFKTIEPDSVSWIFEPAEDHGGSFTATEEYIRDLPVDSPEWDERGGWVWYGAPDDAGKSWTTSPIEPGSYVFAIRAKDEAGAITPVFDRLFNLRRVMVGGGDSGPILTVWNEYIGSIASARCNNPLTITALPAGLRISFCWEASAAHYGGTVTGYRYGWDIDDLSDPNQWEIDYTPFTSPRACSPAREFFLGVHVFTVEVIDNSGFCSRIEIKINIIEFAMEDNLLVVDDFREGSQMGWDDPVAPGLTPNDSQHDAFWEYVLQDVDGFNPAGDIREVNVGDVISLVDLARYKSVIWSVFGHVDAPGTSVLHEYIKFVNPINPTAPGGYRHANILGIYMAGGGHVLLCGNHPVSLSIDPEVTLTAFRFPIVFLYELQGEQERTPNPSMPLIGETSFAYKELCLETMEFSFTDARLRRQYQNYCPINDYRTLPEGALRDHTMRAAVPVDVFFPRLDLRVEAAGTGRQFRADKQGYDTEVYNPQYFSNLCPYVNRPRGCFQPIYALECLDTGEPTYGAPVAFWTSHYADRVSEAPGAVGARSAVFGFPPVYFNPHQVRDAMEEILFEEWRLPRK